MKLNVNLSEKFEQPIEEVWRALTDSHTLARWLMDNDFEPRLGARFTLRRAEALPDWHGSVECEVLEFKFPTRMVWSWSHGVAETPSRVIFELRSEGDGTRLTLRHVGEAGEGVGRLINERWPLKWRALAALLRGER
jgi:uncharacterized protein YndB with AHSA1/START domain